VKPKLIVRIDVNVRPEFSFSPSNCRFVTLPSRAKGVLAISKRKSRPVDTAMDAARSPGPTDAAILPDFLDRPGQIRDVCDLAPLPWTS
jgi:hypothetical protein